MTSTSKIEDIDDNFNPLSQHLTSEVIRSRLLKENVSFFANDNIADHIEPGEIEALEDEVAGRIRDCKLYNRTKKRIGYFLYTGALCNKN